MTDKVWLRWEVCGGYIRIQWAPHWYSPDLPWWSSSVLLVLSLGEATPYWRWLLRWLTPPNNTQHHSDHHKPQSAPPRPSYSVRTPEKVRGRREELERYELWERGRQLEWCWHNSCSSVLHCPCWLQHGVGGDNPHENLFLQILSAYISYIKTCSRYSRNNNWCFNISWELGRKEVIGGDNLKDK